MELFDDAPEYRPRNPIIVLSQHDGYTFQFIEVDSDDPVVMTFLEGHGSQPFYGRTTISQVIGSAVYDWLRNH